MSPRPPQETAIPREAPHDAPVTVGGSALPGGVMMRTSERVGIAVRRDEDGAIVTESFSVHPPKGRWARWPLMRGVVAIRSAVVTGQKAMTIGERLRWEELRPAGEEAADGNDPAGGADRADDAQDAPRPLLGFWGKVGVGVGALLGFALQILVFRVGPVVIAKEAGLTGAAFIVADAAIRLFLLLGVLLFMSLLPPFRKILKYHGAEHQAIAAHEARAPLTAAAAAGFTRFHPRCGTSFLVVSAVVSIAVYGAVLAITGVFTYPALIATRILGAPIVTAIAFEIQRQAAMRATGRLAFLSWPGMAAQHLTTAKPTEEELEVAVAALAVALEPDPDAAAEHIEDPALSVTGGPAPALGMPHPNL
jgi:uncharacterized protein YqhQ